MEERPLRGEGSRAGLPWGVGVPCGREGWAKAAHVQEGAADHVQNDAAQGPDVRFLAEEEVEGFGGHPGLLKGVCWQESVGCLSPVLLGEAAA